MAVEVAVNLLQRLFHLLLILKHKKAEDEQIVSNFRLTYP